MLTLAIGDIFIPDRVIALPPQFTKLLAPNAPNVPSNTKIAQVLCLGNITQSADTLRFLHELSPSLNVVRGEFDDESILSQQLQHLSGKNAKIETVPLYRVVKADNFRIGFTSGHQLVPQNDPLSLLAFAREIDVDVLVWGGTHRVEAYTLDGKFFINPGSATGAFSMGWPDAEESDDEDEDDEVQESEQEEPQNKEADKTESAVKKELDAELLSSSIPSFCLLDTNSSRCTLYIYTHVQGEVKVDKVIYSKE